MNDEKQPPNYAVIDVETTNIKHGEIPKTKFWGYADSKGYKRFETTKQLARFLRREAEPTTLLHHANFDVLQFLVDGETIQILRSHNGRLIRSKFGKHIMLNTLSCFPVALGEIFQNFGYKKTSLRNLDKRNYEDCVWGLECFLKLDELFQEIAFVSPLVRGTIASTSFTAAEKFVGKKMPKDLRFLEAYRGGRVEVFTTNTIKRAHKFDINSSYPRSILEAPKHTELWKIRVKTADPYCPFYDCNRSDLLLFPNGEFDSYVFSDVFHKYIEPNMENTKIRILSRHKISLGWINRLSPFVAELYARKQTAEGALKLCLKLLLNSMYGRMGLKGESERCRVMDYQPDGDDITCYPIGKGRFLVFDILNREVKSNYPFAGYITDNARGRLFEAFVKNKALYGDTDSVITLNSQKQFDGEQGDECGQWKYEGCENFQAINVKDYLWGSEEVRKGGAKFLQWTLKQFARGGTAKEITRTRHTELRKREVLSNGETVPLIVNN